MTILLYKDGKLIVDAEQPLEGVSLDNLAVILSGASDGDVIQYDATKGMWVNKSAPSSLPEVTASDKGKYLKANESTGEPEWAEGGSSGGGVLVVHITWNDNTGTLDKTWQEIHDADAVVIYATTDTGKDYYTFASVMTLTDFLSGDTYYNVFAYAAGESSPLQFTVSSASGYPVCVAE